MTGYLVGYSNAVRSRSELVASRGFSMLDVEVQRRLLAFFEASPVVNGHYSVGFGEGFRDSSAQEAEFFRRHRLDPNGSIVYLGKRYSLKPGMAPLAPPGSSYHEATTLNGRALAADLVGDLTWAHANNTRYGLRDFRNVSNPVEPWHHQPIEIPTARANYRQIPLPTWPLPTIPTPQPQPQGDDMFLIKQDSDPSVYLVIPASRLPQGRCRSHVTAAQWETFNAAYGPLCIVPDVTAFGPIVGA